ncbi:MAG: hypothetical protein KIT80_22490 [Chitinophagaceae bacterium]|nr:hypothetical protein [Chitinophagaceae bacterium]MCW5929705.1 hypothetical protein [Chitinophagaceae bacterium]
MKLITILIFFTPLLLKAQNRDDIIKQIVKINRLESEMKGVGFIPYSELPDSDRIRLTKIPNDYDNYLNFLALVKIISSQELVALTKHSNGVIRMFALRELIKQRDYNYDYYSFFLSEFKNKDSIEWQYGCMISTEPTYEILLQDWSGNWNYARSTGAKEDSKFLDKILKPIDSFILVDRFDFYDGVYTDIFDRQRFDSSLNGRIIELIDTKLNFWAFNYFKKTNPKIFKSIEKKTITNVLKNKTTLLKEHPDFFQWFLRYLVTNKQFDNAKQMIQALPKDEYFNKRLEYMLMSIDKKLVDKVK